MTDQAEVSSTVIPPTVELYVQHSGRMLYYPNNPNAIMFAELMGKKCLDNKHITIIKKLGFSVMQVPNPNIQQTKEL